MFNDKINIRLTRQECMCKPNEEKKINTYGKRTISNKGVD